MLHQILALLWLVSFHPLAMCSIDILLWLFLFALTAITATAVSYSLPALEFNAVKDLYYSTNGNSWRWTKPYNIITGFPWNFTKVHGANPNPCDPVTPWQGILCSTSCKASPCHILQIDLDLHGLHGRIPSSIQNITTLQIIYVRENHLTGPIEIPLKAFSKITGIRGILMNNNNFTGTIPSDIFNIPLTFQSLAYLEVDSNFLTGTIPNTFGFYLPQLLTVDFYNNHLTGSLPMSLAQITTLQSILFATNHTTGLAFPPEFCSLKQLEDIENEENQFSGNLPDCLATLPELTIVSWGRNQISGTLPWFGRQSNITMALQSLIIDLNALTGTLPNGFGQNLPELTEIFINANHFSGTLPDSLSNATNVVTVYLATNHFSGQIPSSLKNWVRLADFSLATNALTGTIPDWFGEMPKLKTIYLNDNQFSVTIPVSLVNLTKLFSLSLSNNQLTGTLPEVFGYLSDLNGVSVASNRLTGTIPASLSNLNSSIELYMHYNFFSGTIPSSILTMESLVVLYAFHNLLTGAFPELEEFSFDIVPVTKDINQPTWSETSTSKNLQIVDMSTNYMVGMIPESISQFVQLNELVVSNNLLTGSLPDTLNQIQLLQILSCSYNFTTNTLPETFHDLIGLQELVLHNNLLSGSIDVLSTGFNKLQVLYLDNNTFT
jgi:Leucine-rich repeat (LRR) protein